MYYAADNSCASSTSHGFANTWFVLAFDTKAHRDQYVADANNLACCAISRRQVTGYAANWSLTRNEYNKPEPFSGEYWGICDWRSIEAEGLIGSIEVCAPDENWPRFY
jgi:hypothetical protein